MFNTMKKVTPVVLPHLDYKPTAASGSRGGAKVVRVVLHRWGVAYTGPVAEAGSYRGVIREFLNPTNDASAHIVFPGSAVRGKATQMVPWSRYAWTEAGYNPSSVEIECADAVWLGHDPYGLQVAARMTAFLLNKYDLPSTWSKERGFCRHADLGTKGGGHLQCPTTNMAVWKTFAHMVKHETKRGDFLKVWGRE